MRAIPSPTSNRSSLVRDAALLRESMGELIRILQFRERDRSRHHGLSVSHCHGLQALVREGPMTVTRLGDSLYLEKSTASRLAKGLLDEGLIRKRNGESDGRVVILQVTEQGLRLSRRILNELSEEYMDLLEGFEPEVRGTLPRALERLTQALLASTSETS